MAGNDSEKTEQPTGQRLQKARDEGNVAKTREMSAALTFIGMAIFMYYYTPMLATDLSRFMREAFISLYQPLDIKTATKLTLECMIFMTKVLAPIMGLMIIINVAANVMQFGFLISSKAIEIKFDKLDPIKGFGKIFSKRSLVELLKSLFKIFVIGLASFYIIKDKVPTIIRLNNSDMMDGIVFFLMIAFELFLKIGVIVLILAIIDFMYQKWQNNEELKMTKQEVKEEFKQMEGDPLIKQKIRSMQREMARKRMMEDVPKSDVVITNPTHFAVALRYSPGDDRAPIVTAKGQRLLALRIRETARKSGVLVHEDPPLARTLFKTVDIGDEIPENLYKAIAEILALVGKFKHMRR